MADGRLVAELGLDPSPLGSHLHLPSFPRIVMTKIAPFSNPNMQCDPVVPDLPSAASFNTVNISACT